MLIAEELISKIRDCDKLWGYIDGFIKGDVIGVFAVDLGGEETIPSMASLIVARQRHFDKHYGDKLACWVKVKKGILHKIKNLNMEFEELKQWLPEDLSELIQQLTMKNLLVLEEDSQELLPIRIFEMKLVFPGEVQLLEKRPDPFKRIDGLIPLEEMKKRVAVIVGLGSGGSTIAMELAAAGIGTLHLFDKDRLSSVNLFRHICGVRDLGRQKIDAVEDVIKDHSLPTNIEKCSYDIMVWPEKLVEAVQQSDIVICATDNSKSRAMVNYICVKMNKPLILVCTYDNAKIGEIFRVIPSQTACYECSRIYLKAQGALIDDNVSRDAVLPYSSQLETMNGNSRGTRTDVFIVAAMAARVSLMTLINNTDIGFGKLPYNYITWGAIRNTEFMEPYNFKQPFATNYRNFNIHPDCPLCGTLAKEIRDINVEEQYHEIMQKLSL